MSQKLRWAITISKRINEILKMEVKTRKFLQNFVTQVCNFTSSVIFKPYVS